MDQFGADPQVRALRRIFGQMEQYDHQMARALNLAWTDARLRDLRERALAGHQAQLSRLAELKPKDGDIYLEAYRASYCQAAAEMGFQPPAEAAK